MTTRKRMRHVARRCDNCTEDMKAQQWDVWRIERFATAEQPAVARVVATFDTRIRAREYARELNLQHGPE